MTSPDDAGSDRPATRSRWALAGLLALVVVILAAGIAVWVSSGSHEKQAGPAGTTTTTTTPRVTTFAPLTGLPDPGGAAGRRCAVTVKVDNTPAALPHRGIDQADVIYEEVVEGGITRLAVVFNSHAPDEVGPVRSVRRTDQSIVWPLRGVFAYSGGAPYAIASIATAPVTRIDETHAGSAMFRDPTRAAPHNLYARVDQLYKRCADPAPPPLFTYRPRGRPAAGTPATSVLVGFHFGYAVSWTWDAGSGTWQRSLFGAPETVASGRRVSAANVVVMFVNYAGGVGAFGAEATLTGRGYALVFTGGREIKGTWSRPGKTRGAQLFDAAGRPIYLTPGATWVELPDVSYAVTVTP